MLNYWVAFVKLQATQLSFCWSLSLWSNASDMSSLSVRPVDQGRVCYQRLAWTGARTSNTYL